MLNVSETAGGGMTKLIQRKTTIPTPSCMSVETAGGVPTLLVERNATSKLCAFRWRALDLHCEKGTSCCTAPREEVSRDLLPFPFSWSQQKPQNPSPRVLFDPLRDGNGTSIRVPDTSWAASGRAAVIAGRQRSHRLMDRNGRHRGSID